MDLAAVAARLRGNPAIFRMPAPQRRREIQIALLDVPDADPRDDRLIADLEARLRPILPRVKQALGATDAELSRLLRKSRPTVQSYIGGRLAEKISPAAARDLRARIEARIAELQALIADIDRIASR